mgnify:CR=1 FL=1
MYSYLSQSQQLAVDTILQGHNVFITGSAGTGKSYLLSFLKEALKHRNFHITATTGIASVNIGGITLHSWAGIGIEDVPVEKIAQKILTAKGTNTRKRLQATEILAIDEISMLSMETFEKIDKLLRLIRDKDLPFNTKREALILASIVEKETGIEELIKEIDNNVYLKELYGRDLEKYKELIIQRLYPANIYWFLVGAYRNIGDEENTKKYQEELNKISETV